jgi:hypothetical protein
MEETQIDDDKVVSSSSSSSSSSFNSRPLKRKFMRWLIVLDDGQIESVKNRFEELDLAIAI